MSQYVAAIDQGTSSTRCMIFDHDGRVVSADQREHRQILLRPGWVQHDATEVWTNTREVAAGALAKADLAPSDLAAVGISNQRRPPWCGTGSAASRCTTRSSGRTPAPTGCAPSSAGTPEYSPDPAVP